MAYWDKPGASDEWYTPKYVFDALGCEFDLDVASPHVRGNVPAKVWLDAEDDGLKLAPFWTGFVWMNPPFGGRNGLEPWLDAFFLHGNGVALTPDRTSAPWFRSAWGKTDAVLFTPKIRFLKPDGTEGTSPSNGTCLWAVGASGLTALLKAKDAGLGIMGFPA